MDHRYLTQTDEGRRVYESVAAAIFSSVGEPNTITAPALGEYRNPRRTARQRHSP